MTSIVVDGSVLEGGGQILRNAISLSALLRQPVVIEKIRDGRTPPGLKNQHRTGLELAAEIASADLSGAHNGSTHIEFRPRGINLPGEWKADSKTAGSVTLLLQVSLPLLLFSPSQQPGQASILRLLGGTNATQAPQIDYTKHVFLPFLREHFGLERINLEVRKRGYFPKGGGEVVVHVFPILNENRLKGFSLLDRGRIMEIGGVAHFAKLPSVVGTGMAEGARRRLGEWGGLNVEGDIVPVRISAKRERNDLSLGGGSGLVLWARLEGGGIIGGSAVGVKDMHAEVVGELAASELIRGLDAGGCIDEWLQDQIIIFMALAEGRSEVKCGKGGLELHTKTAIWLAEKLTGAKFEIKEEESGHTIIRCEGIGYTAPTTNGTNNMSISS
ncbi:RTC domain-containing 1 [Cyathus striatus]|nr:RTC domain-containing 1 [Cyathus striatus]